MKLLIILLTLTVTAMAQDPFRFELPGNNEPVVAVSRQVFVFNNGPLGETTYNDHTFAFSFNTANNNTKIIPNEVSFGLTHESKYRNEAVGQLGSFMTEIYYQWTNPANTFTFRPWGFTVDHDTGFARHSIQGQIYLLRNVGNGGQPWGIWHDDGYLDLTTAPQGSIGFKNNTAGFRWRNAGGTNSVAPLFVDNQDRIVIGGGQVDTIVNSSNLRATTMVYSGTVKRGSTQILGAQCAEIPDSDGTKTDDTRAINAMLGCLRQHGIIATDLDGAVIK